jgi:predicted adenylyl cyclase CyaB
MKPGRNIELKARCNDLPAAASRAAELGARRVGMLVQTDTYFNVPAGRLKLREVEGHPAALIWYDRPDSVEFRGSDYYVVPVAEAALMKEALTRAMGVRMEVRKRRELWMWENVRIHLDDVDALGTFVEFEAVMRPDADEEISRARLGTLSNLLKVRDQDRIDVSYCDLMKERQPHQR